MITAYKLYTGHDGNSHVIKGSIPNDYMSDAKSIRFQESPPHSSYDWHNAPQEQFVITLAGTLKFTTHSGETFTIKPGDVLIALDTKGTAHKWELIDENPWKRVYVVFQEGTAIAFTPENDS